MTKSNRKNRGGSSGEQSRVSRLRDFLNFTVADAGCAGAQALMRSIDDRAHRLNIDVPAPVGHVMSVTHLMPELRTFAA